jgi:hypothetical protein
MADSETLFRKSCCVCGEPLRETPRWRQCCSRACLLVRLDWETGTELRFILTNLRCFGGGGFRTLEERMSEAVRRLPIDEGPLAELLIEIVQIA